ncbi:hypothetical protein ACU4GR_17980 [Methylobacterium oryzae CBMB20]
MSTSDLTLAGETLPAETSETVLSDADLAALRRAVEVLERPSLAARLSAAAGAPLDIIGRSLPAPVTEAVSRSTEVAMRGRCGSPWRRCPARSSSPPRARVSAPSPRRPRAASRGCSARATPSTRRWRRSRARSAARSGSPRWRSNCRSRPR